MKKILNLLSSITLVGSTLVTVVSCSKKNIKNEGSSATNNQKEMIEGAEFMTRLIIGGRHENLNYNLNEVLSSFITPSNTALKLPTAYTYNGKDIDLSKKLNSFKNVLAPGLNAFNNDSYLGVYASYIMGMYDDDFYKNIISPENNKPYFEDTFSDKGNVGNNKKKDNAFGYLAGLNKDINLSSNQERWNLSWGIQDTGALTNFLLNNGLDGGFPGEVNRTKGTDTDPEDKDGGTNASGYLWYNSVISNPNPGSKTNTRETRPNKYDDINKKLKNSNLNITGMSGPNSFGSNIKYNDKDYEFNNTGSLFVNKAGELNVNGNINAIGSMLDNIVETESGALILGELLSYILPIKRITSGYTAQLTQNNGFGMINDAWKGIYNLLKSDEYSGAKTFLEEQGFKLKNKDYLNLDDALSFGLKDNIGFEQLYKTQNNDKEEGKNGTNAKYIIKFIEDIETFYNNLKDNDKNKFAEKIILNSDSPFYNAYKSKLSIIDKDGSLWESVIKKDGSGGIKLLNIIKRVFQDATNDKIKEQVENAKDFMEDIGNSNYSTYSLANKKEYLKRLGYVDGKYEKGSFLQRCFEGLKDSSIPGSIEIAGLLSGFKNIASNEMKELHENVIQYLYEDKYWKQDDIVLSTTSSTSIGGKMEFELTYTGNGDKTSNASTQTKEVNVPENFNPYQTNIKHQQGVANSLKSKIDESRISGEVLVNNKSFGWNWDDDKFIAYDGLGNYNNYKPVNNKYKVVWENISQDPQAPYWVVTSIKCFNENGKQFYNIY